MRVEKWLNELWNVENTRRGHRQINEQSTVAALEKKLGCALYKKTLSRFAEILIPRKKLAVPYTKKNSWPGPAQPSPARTGRAHGSLGLAMPGRSGPEPGRAVPYIKKLGRALYKKLLGQVAGSQKSCALYKKLLGLRVDVGVFIPVPLLYCKSSRTKGFPMNYKLSNVTSNGN